MNTENPTVKKAPLIIFVLCFITYTSSYIGRMNYSACMSSMIEDGLFDKVFAGYLITSFLILYGSGQLINGIIGSHISPRIIISVGFIGTATANLSMAFVTNKYALLIIWGLCGYFCSMFWSPIIRIFSEWLPQSKRYKAGLFISLTVPAGTILSYLMSSITLKFYNWKIVFIASALFLLLAFVIWTIGHTVIHNYWQQTAIANNSIKEQLLAKNIEGHKVPLISIIISTSLFVAILSVVFSGMLKEPVINLIPRYFKEQFDTSSSFASLISIILPVVSIPGAFVATSLNKKFFRNEVKTCSLMFVTSAVSLAIAFFLNQSSVILAAVFIGFSVSSMWGINTMLVTFVPYHFSKIGKSSSIAGLLNCCSQLSSAVFSTVYAYTSVSIGWNKTVLFWVCLAIGGSFISIVFSKLWGKRISAFET